MADELKVVIVDRSGVVGVIPSVCSGLVGPSGPPSGPHKNRATS
jgi:hypothetical protein